MASPTALEPMASGGGVLNTGDLVVDRSVFVNNEATRAGGAIEANGGVTVVIRSTLGLNATGPGPGNGGGLHLTGAGRADIDCGTVTGNAATAEGGGLWNSSTGTMIVRRTTVRANTAPAGPDVFNDGGTFVLVNAVLGPLVLIGATGGFLVGDAPGAAWGLALAAAVTAPLWWMQLERIVRRAVAKPYHQSARRSGTLSSCGSRHEIDAT